VVIVVSLMRFIEKASRVSISVMTSNRTPSNGSRRTLPPVAPGYRFIHIDVQNDRYHPNGAQTAGDLRLDVLPQTPTLVLMLSVFTHMYGPDIKRYLQTVAEKMDSRTVLYVTFFLLNPEQRELEKAGRTARPFRHVISEYCRCFSLEDPLWPIASPRSGCMQPRPQLVCELKKRSMDHGRAGIMSMCTKTHC
jgi:hypothetical protein